MKFSKIIIFYLILIVGFVTVRAYNSPDNNWRQDQTALGRRVREFLDRNRYRWYNLNVPESDGRILYDLIIERGYSRALVIGTSTGHSAIWMAWALSKTGGKLITIEIDAGRYRQAVANFKEAGLDRFIEARLGDAHEIVPALPGPFDFVFCDADKEWYKNYLEAVLPKLEPGGRFAAHNVGQVRGSRWLQPGIREFLDYAFSRPELETSFAA